MTQQAIIVVQQLNTPKKLLRKTYIKEHQYPNMESKDPAFLFYPKDWIEGTAEFHPCEKGVFIDLLAHIHQKRSLPVDTIRLARIAGLSEDEFLKTWVIIKEKFFEENGRLYNKKMISVSHDRQDKSKKNKIIGTFASLIRLRHESQEIKKQIQKFFKVDEFLTVSTDFLTERLTDWYIGRLKSIEDANANSISKGNEGTGEKPLEPEIEKLIAPAMQKKFTDTFPKYPPDKEKDFPACLQMAYSIGEELGFTWDEVLKERKENVLKRWGEIIIFIAADKWFSKRSLNQLNNEWQSLIQSLNSNGTNSKNTTATETVFDRP